MPVAGVTIHSSDGRPFVHVTEAKTLFESGHNAVEWFAHPYWKGPKTRRDTVYEVSVVRNNRKWKVHAAAVEQWRSAGLARARMVD